MVATHRGRHGRGLAAYPGDCGTRSNAHDYGVTRVISWSIEPGSALSNPALGAQTALYAATVIGAWSFGLITESTNDPRTGRVQANYRDWLSTLCTA